MQKEISNSDVADFYDDYVTHQIKNGYNLRHQHVLKRIKPYFSPTKSISLLEIGCGIGITSNKLLQNFNINKLIGIDISSKSIDYAKKLNASYAHSEFLCGDIFELDIKEKTVDLILMMDVLEHIPKSKHLKIFEKLSSLMTDDSFIILNIPYGPCLDYIIKYDSEGVQVIEEPIYLHELSTIFEQTNIEIVGLETFGMWLEDEYQLYKIRKRRPFKKVNLEPKEDSKLTRIIKKVTKKGL